MLIIRLEELFKLMCIIVMSNLLILICCLFEWKLLMLICFFEVLVIVWVEIDIENK